MLDQIFSLDKFNIIQDSENYYFFRALNMADNTDIETGVTVNNGNIVLVRTDLERYKEEAIYNHDDEVSLKQVFDHIKMHQRKDTNCISLTSNANVAINYGRGNYKDKYVMIKVPKDKIGINVFNAGSYMLKEVEKIVDKIIGTEELDEMQKYLLDFIKNASSSEKLDEVKRILPKEFVANEDMFENGLTFTRTSTKDYNALNREQNLEKEKLIMKIDVLKKQLIKGVSNKLLIQTIGNAFSSLEYIHYQKIEESEIINISKEQMDIIGLLQQLPDELEFKNEIIKQVIRNANSRSIGSFAYENVKLDNSDLTMEKVYDLTLGKINYSTVKYLYNSIFYLTKSRLRNTNNAKELRKLLNNNTKYNEIYEYIENKTYGIEPEICTRASKDLITISESVSLDINPQYKDLIETVNNMSRNELLSILSDPFENIMRLLMNTELSQNGITMSKEEYIANSIIDNFNWKKYGVEAQLSLLQRNDIIKSLIDHNFMDTYKELKAKNISEDNISTILFKSIIRDNVSESNKDLTLEEIEAFVGYNKVKGLNLSLYSYQRSALENIDRLFESKDFACAILPTGAGKSYVALAEMYERVMKNPEEKILYLAPNEEILNQMKQLIRKVYKPEEHLGEDINKVISRVFKNVQFATYQDLKDYKADDVKDKFASDYNLIVFDELHRTGASEWKNSVESLLIQQESYPKILGITATPQRDVDMLNMADYWAYQYGYTEEEIVNDEHLAINMDIIEAIQSGIIYSPKVISCLYSTLEDGTLDKLNEDIQNITDVKERNEALKNYKKLRETVENADGVEKVLCDNLKSDGKYIFFLPVTKKNGTYEDEDGNKVDKSTAERMIKDYQTLVKQYIYGFNYLNEHERIKELYDKISGNIELTEDEKKYLLSEKENILILSKINIIGKPSSLNTNINTISDAIINHMEWEELTKETKEKILTKKTEDTLETYSMLGSYAKDKNFRNLNEFNKPANKKMKLMFAMNKFNEGIHPEGITGIVWLRALDDNSKILYLQQLGRAIHAAIPGLELNEENRPVVIDLVNNTLKVRLEKESNEEITIRKLNNIIDVMNFRNLEGINDLDDSYLLTLNNIYNNYINYVTNTKELGNVEDVKTKIRIRKIIEIGSTLDLWSYQFPEISVKETKENEKNNYEDMVNLFRISGVEKDFVDLYDQVQSLSNVGVLKERIHYIYTEYYDTGLPKWDSPDTFIGGTSIANWIGRENKKKIIEESQNGNEEAMWIVEQKKWLNKDEYRRNLARERIHYIYTKYYDNGLPSWDSLDEFKDGALITNWLSSTKDIIIEESQNGNEDAMWIVKEKKWNYEKKDLLKERIHYIYTEYCGEGKSLPVKRSSDKFKDGITIGEWLTRGENKEKIMKESQKGNVEAKWIVEQRKWNQRIMPIHEKIHYVYINYSKNNKSLPTGKSADKFKDGIKIAPWLSNKANRERIIELSQKGNTEAKWIVEQRKWNKGKKDRLKERIHYIYAKYYDKDLPSFDSSDTFAGGVKIGRWLNAKTNMERIIEESQNGNEEAMWIAEQKKWLNKDEYRINLLKERIRYIYMEYCEKGKPLPTNKSTDIFEDGIKIAPWLYAKTNKERIIELSQNGNEEARGIVEQGKWLNKDEYKSNLLKEKIHYIYKEYYEKGEPLPKNDSLDTFEDKTKIVNWLDAKTNRERIIEESQNGNVEAKWIVEQRKWLNMDEYKRNLLKEKIHYIYTKYYDEGLPNWDSPDTFIGGTSIVNWLYAKTNREKIIEESQSGNAEAMWIVEQKNWLNKKGNSEVTNIKTKTNEELADDYIKLMESGAFIDYEEKEKIV